MIQIDNQYALKVKLDTGAQYNVISLHKLKSLFGKKHNLEKTLVRLRAYGGAQLQVLVKLWKRTSVS